MELAAEEVSGNAHVYRSIIEIYYTTKLPLNPRPANNHTSSKMTHIVVFVFRADVSILGKVIYCFSA